MAHVPYEPVMAQLPIVEEEESRPSEDSRSNSLCGEYPDDDHDGYVPGDLDFEEYVPIQLDVTEMVRRDTIESYIGDDWDEDGDDHSSLSLFHAGYSSYDSGWAREYEPTIVPVPARKPLPKPKVPSRAPTLLVPNNGEAPQDSNLVTWDKDDPANPHNWPSHRRWTSTVLIAMFAFIAPMASTMVAPALDTIADDYGIESQIEKFLVMSIFLLAFAVGPFLWGIPTTYHLVAMIVLMLCRSIIRSVWPN